MKPIILIGGGGHCKSVAEAVISSGRTIFGVLDVAENVGKEILDFKIIGTDDDIIKYASQYEFVITVGHIKDSSIRRKIAQKVSDAGGVLATVIANTANVSRYAKVGAGSVILHGVMVNAGAKIGENCIINTLANIEHDAIIEDFCHISTGTMINGNTKIEHDTFIGSNSMIKESIKIGDNSTIGGGGGHFKIDSPKYSNSKPFKIGYFADGPWSHLAFEKLINDPQIEIAFIVPRTDTKDDTLYNYAKKYSINYITPVKINSEQFYQVAKGYNCDLFVSMSFNQIFKDKITNLPELGTINCHAGKLPFYRGRNILNWALINDEKEFGITVHYIDQGIDTGDIIEQRTYPITEQDTYKTLLNTAIVECANILYDSIKEIQNKTSKRIPQNSIDQYGFYCGIRSEGDEIIDWRENSREIFNFVRAICKPGPMARSFCNNNEVKINACKYYPDAPKYRGTVGQIIGMENGNAIVKTADSIVVITEYESEIRLKVGDRLK